MDIYILGTFLILILGIGISVLGEDIRKKKILFLFFAFSILGLIMILRDRSIGTDTNAYCKVFERIRDSNSIESFKDIAFGYAIYNLLLSKLFYDPQWLIIINGLIIIIGIAIFIYNNSENPIMSTIYFILFYFYFTSFNLSRQYIAVILVANAYSFIKKKKVVPAAILITIAILFHNTAIFGLIFLLFTYLKMNNRNMWILIIGSSIAPIFYNYALELFIDIFPRYKLYISRLLTNKYEAQGRKIIITFVYIGIVAVAIYLLVKKKELFNKVEEAEMKRLICITFIAIIIGLISVKSSLFGRIETYFSIFSIILIPKVIERFGRFRYAMYYLSVIVMSIPCYIQLAENLSDVNPYKFFF